MTFDAAALPFAKLMGVEILHADKDRIEGRLVVREDLCTAGGILHGGAMMAFADSLGAVGAFLNLSPGAHTTTLESKTNFIGSAKVGTTVTAVSTPLHVGRRSSVWQTRIEGETGKLVALITQTQMTLEQ
ncbi:PaaI family thioesterase [Caulobacter mirabilis]|uniref:Phenylacetic acid degradation protein n=1 Tax=Caulobacter mirabilis TaxID=69666 RepID=A0A2D2B2F6_9CAUL|nr:PaaI family thioesterase [Caulobacter mirabilis]ATQ44424.1 phenylacetic acid degradation protein [Caulobacter mirabilis]